jgi:hypothetical protein
LKDYIAPSIAINVHKEAVIGDRAVGGCRREYEILIEATANSQKGVIHFHTVRVSQWRSVDANHVNPANSFKNEIKMLLSYIRILRTGMRRDQIIYRLPPS